MGQSDYELLKRLARSYIWWKSPDESACMGVHISNRLNVSRPLSISKEET